MGHNETQEAASGPSDVEIGPVAKQMTRGLLLVLGIPPNFSVFLVLSRAYIHRQSFSRFALLKLHLSISDVLVLLVYCISTTAWEYTGEWRGGNLLCKIVQFLNPFTFYLCSNIMVCIAAERFYSVRGGTTSYSLHFNATFALLLKRAKHFIIGAWLLAFLSALPQLYIFTTHTLHGQNQCVTIWDVRRLAAYASINASDPNATRLVPSGLYQWESVYGLTHLSVVFGVPGLLIILFNSIVMCRLNKRAKECRQSLQMESPLRRRSTIRASRPVHWSVAVGSTVLRRTVLLSAAYVLCWLPYNMLAALLLVEPAWMQRAMPYMEGLSDLMVVNAVINPILYRVPGQHLTFKQRLRRCCSLFRFHTTEPAPAGYESVTVFAEHQL